jgi:stage II sporulation protein M
VGLLLRLGNSIFNREELLGRTIDSVNFTGTLKKIWRYVRAVDDDGTTARNPLDWYRRAVPYTLRKLKTPGLITLAIFVLYFLTGYLVGQMPQFQLPLEQNMAVSELPPEMGLGISETRFMGFIIFQNARVLLVSTLLAALSFGVMALIIPPLVFGVLGYLASQVIPIGMGAILAAGILPHGIIEIPTVLLATAAMLRLGAVITKPPEGQTVGHAWLVAFSDVVKLWLALIIPGLIIGAALEAFVTVNVLQMVIGG